jgi:DNA topoisomerase-1
MAKSLIIVESPKKAKTIKKFLGRGYAVLSSYGHIRDLPKSKLGVDVDNDFSVSYVIPKDNKDKLKKLQDAADKADTIYLATDDDREGEAISWHLTQALKLKDKEIKRIVFREITKPAIVKALEEPRDLNIEQVNAQQARRVLDRLVGYKLSPFLWKKVARGLSAGRVQSVAVRFVVEREREIKAFDQKEYWSITAACAHEKHEFPAILEKQDGKKLDKFDVNSEEAATSIVKQLKGKSLYVSALKSTKKKKAAPTPFKTSTLQQEASSRLGYSPKQTMRIAQQLYEGIEIGKEQTGLITYMRTDSLNLSEIFLAEAKAYILQAHGDAYYAGKARRFKTKKKDAQEAHEAIRPTSAFRSPASIKAYLTPQQFKLYNLIWQRSLATQMADAETRATRIDLETKEGTFGFKANGSVITFDGFLKVYTAKQTKDVILPELSEGDTIKPSAYTPEQHFTQPPARYSEATLVKALEEYGIGRPATYAPTISTIQDRNYIVKEEGRLHPTEIAMIVNDLLVEHFSNIVNFEFTAGMEETLDHISQGEADWIKTIKEFYNPFMDNIKVKEKELDKKKLTEQETDHKCPKCEAAMVIKFGRFGKFLACSAYPDCKTTLPIDENNEIIEEKEETVDIECDKCGSPMAKKRGRFGEFLGCSNYPECKNIMNIEKKTGVACAKCDSGEIIEKRSKRGKIFFGCNQYPKCDFALWSKPTGDKCPECSSLLVFGAKNTIRCSNKECKYKTTLEEK